MSDPAAASLKAWITVSETAEPQWPGLASEALAFVGGQEPPPLG